MPNSGLPAERIDRSFAAIRGLANAASVGALAELIRA